MDKLHWCIAWSAAVAPEPSMIPDRGVFLRAASGRSLTATVEGSASDLWGEDPMVSPDAITVDVVEMEEVEELCCCSTLTPELKQKNEEWLDLALFV